MSVDEMQAGPEINMLIAERVMGWRQSSLPGVFIDEDERFWGVTDEMPTSRQFNPSTDIAAAWQVVEKLNLLENKILTKNEDGKYIVCDIAFFGEWPDYYAGASELAPLAICRAALKAVMGENAKYKHSIPGLPHAVFSGELDESGAPIYNVPFPMPDKGDEIE